MVFEFGDYKVVKNPLKDKTFCKYIIQPKYSFFNVQLYSGDKSTNIIAERNGVMRAMQRGKKKCILFFVEFARLLNQHSVNCSKKLRYRSTSTEGKMSFLS